MAKRYTTNDNIALEIRGEPPSPTKFARAIHALSELLNRALVKCDDVEPVDWRLNIQDDGRIIKFVPKNRSINQKTINFLDSSFLALAIGKEAPTEFDEGMISNLLVLLELGSDKTGKREIYLWLNGQAKEIGEHLEAYGDHLQDEAYFEHGTVDGEIESIEDQDGLVFLLREPIHGHLINCKAGSKEMIAKARNLSSERIQVEGQVKYSARGLPLEIKVETVEPIIPEGGLLDYRLTKGILQPYV